MLGNGILTNSCEKWPIAHDPVLLSSVLQDHIFLRMHVNRRQKKFSERVTLYVECSQISCFAGYLEDCVLHFYYLCSLV